MFLTFTAFPFTESSGVCLRVSNPRLFLYDPSSTRGDVYNLSTSWRPFVSTHHPSPSLSFIIWLLSLYPPRRSRMGEVFLNRLRLSLLLLEDLSTWCAETWPLVSISSRLDSPPDFSLRLYLRRITCLLRGLERRGSQSLTTFYPSVGGPSSVWLSGVHSLKSR